MVQKPLNRETGQCNRRATGLGQLALGMLAGLALLTFTLLGAIRCVSFDRDFYLAEFRKFDIPSATYMSWEDLTRSVDALLQYLAGARSSPQLEVTVSGARVPLYTQRELLHLQDVAHLYSLSLPVITVAALLFFLLLAAALVLARRRAANNLAGAAGRFLKSAGATALLLLGVVTAASMVDFHQLFTLFHLASFSNDLWLLDPSQHNLIRMFPEPFFFDAASRAIKASALACAAVTALGHLLLQSERPPATHG